MVNWALIDFWKYWAIAIPLTIVVMGIWAAYMIVVDRRNMQKTGEAQDKFHAKFHA